MCEELLPSIQEREAWLKAFGRQTYRDAFRSYTERFGPLYMEAARNCGDPGGPGPKTAGWAGARLACTAVLGSRGVVRAEEKQMVVVYLSPMLLGLGGAACQSLAQALMEQWAGPLARATDTPWRPTIRSRRASATPSWASSCGDKRKKIPGF